MDWLGDIGGLIDIMIYIGRVLVEPFSHFSLHATLMVRLFRSYGYDHASCDSKIELMKHQFYNHRKISQPSWLIYKLGCCCGRKRRHQNVMLEKSKSTLVRQMDLKLFLEK